jgi:hypothetical protein
MHNQKYSNTGKCEERLSRRRFLASSGLAVGTPSFARENPAAIAVSKQRGSDLDKLQGSFRTTDSREVPDLSERGGG